MLLQEVPAGLRVPRGMGAEAGGAQNVFNTAGTAGRGYAVVADTGGTAAAVQLCPAVEAALGAEEGDGVQIITGGWCRRAAAVGDDGVQPAAMGEHGNRTGRVALHFADHVEGRRCDRSEHVGCPAGQDIGHAAAVGVAGGVHPLAVHAGFGADLLDDLPGKAHIIDGAGLGTAGSQVPGVIDALRVGNDDILLIGHFLGAGVVQLVITAGMQCVEVEQQRHLAGPGIGARDMQQILAALTVDVQAALMLAGPQRIIGAEGRIPGVARRRIAGGGVGRMAGQWQQQAGQQK